MQSKNEKESKTLATGIAPALRAYYGRRRVLVGFSPAASPAEKHLTISLHEDQLTADQLLAALPAGLDQEELPVSIQVEGLGCFVVRQPDPVRQKGRLAGRLCLVTGAAQGFGAGIARELAAAGGHVIVADLNLPLAGQVAEDLNQQFGVGTALALPVDVGQEESVCQLVQDTVLAWGGIDLLVSNAGVLRAGGLAEMDLASFDFVTRINYTAFFLMAKYCVVPMRIQARIDQEYFADIVQVNSKSGLEGSNRNFAYAGSKFGGIGLVQSFAKELVEDRIKVNAVCPGNFYEGPLWSDPEKGLFVQYLEAGKVPGARTVTDVYNHYVAQVPLRRGCSPLDVSRAIFYCVEQMYETGQAIPVTGGQNMLK